MDRDPPAPNNMIDITLQGSGLRRHGPTQALRAWVPSSLELLDVAWAKPSSLRLESGAVALVTRCAPILK